jgi:hypothetical protein
MGIGAMYRAVSGLHVSAAQEAAVDSAERGRVLQAVIENLRHHYFEHDVARKMAEALMARKPAGDSAAIDGIGYAHWLTLQMRDVSHDMHLEAIYSADPLPEPSRAPSPERLARYRQMLQDENCMFEKVEILPHNVGYFKLNFFPEPEYCGAEARAAMAKLNYCSAVIFDLRDNRGAVPEMTKWIAAYLFDHPEYWYNPREAASEQSWTSSPVPGNKLAGKAVFVLTSHTTISGAEQFAYNLQMLKRATIVGETTAGAAHAGVFHRIDDHFGVAIPEVRPLNPYGKNDWEGVGVEPDVKAPAADALKVATALAAKQLGAK